MLINFYFEGRKFSLCRKSSRTKSGNVITLIVGKNGTGKSRLMRAIVLTFLRNRLDVRDMRVLSEPLQRNLVEPIGDAEFSIEPTHVVCASTSPFDKFPLPRRQQQLKAYSYLGLRGLQSQNLGPAYMARIIYTLIEAADASSQHAQSIGDVLRYLNYEESISVSFGINSLSLNERFLDAGEDLHALRSLMSAYVERSPMMVTDASMRVRQLVDVDDRTLRKIARAVRRLAEGPKRPNIAVRLGANGVQIGGSHDLGANDVAILGRYGLIKLREVELLKNGASVPLRMTEMSSGEQSVIMGLLGIGSQIQDGALVCIDEPEVCLHPEWQERYIQLLSRIFSHYSGCHFIVATHSPQIVAQLPSKNCFVMDMEDGVARSASEFASQSVDFQLATLFRAPGFKNEYLSRLALNVFVQVAKEKIFDSESLKSLEILIGSYKDLRSDDPLCELINSLREMHRKYGGH